MKKLPPPILVETWLFIVINSKYHELDEVQLSVRHTIKHYFGSMELAQLYVEQMTSDKDNTYLI